MASELERHEARALLARCLVEAVKIASKLSPHPELVFAAAPMTFAGLAGSYLLTMLQSRMIADGEIDKLLSLAAASMRQHADPSLVDISGPPEGVDVDALRAWVREHGLTL